MLVYSKTKQTIFKHARALSNGNLQVGVVMITEIKNVSKSSFPFSSKMTVVNELVKHDCDFAGVHLNLNLAKTKQWCDGGLVQR